MILFDLDDFAPEKQNGFDYLIYLKSRYPIFKVTLFTILGKWKSENSMNLLRSISKFDWINLAAHGFYHNSNDEVLSWTKEDWFSTINKYEQSGLFVKIFKAPNWEMSRLGYQVLKELDWAVAVRKEQIKDVPKDMKYYCFEDEDYMYHGHTWLLDAHQQEGMFNNWRLDINFDFINNCLKIK